MLTSPYPTCCRDGAEREGRAADIVRASYFGEGFLQVQGANIGGMGNATEFVSLSQDEARGGNMTQIRCVMGNGKLHNVLSARAPRSGEDDDTTPVWIKTTVKCCVDRSAPGVVPVPGEEGPIPEKCADYEWSSISIAFDWAFTIAFTIEMFIQFIAKGCFGDKPNRALKMEGSYFRSPWNWLDFTVVVVSYMSEIPGVDNVSALRTFRVLRPLRTLTAIPSMRALINSLFKSLPNMQYVILLMLFLPIVFGVIAVQLWGGLLRGRCMYLDTTAGGLGEWIEDDFQDGRLCSVEFLPITAEKYPSTNGVRANPYVNLGRVCEDRFYGNDTWTVANKTMACRAASNPNYGQTHFDTIWVAMLWVFADITLEGWVDNMYMINDVFALRNDFLLFLVNIYFTLMVLLGGFFMLNLALAVVWDNYQKESEAAEKAVNDAVKFANMERDRNILFRWKAKAKLKAKRRKTRRASEVEAASQVAALEQSTEWASGGDTGDDTVTSIPRILPAQGTLKRKSSERRLEPPPSKTHIGGVSSIGSSSIFGLITESHSREVEAEKERKRNTCCYRLTYATRPLVTAPKFNHFITFVILINTLVMAMEYSTPDTHYYTPKAYTVFLEDANTVCSVIFLVEMILKLIGIGWTEYSKDAFNLFDMVIVDVSIFEWIYAAFSSGDGGGGGFGVLRVFRVLRVFKLAKSWKELNNLIRLIGLSIMDVASASMLLLVIMFIFAMVGMQLFGGQWDAEKFYPDDPPRANFDNFWWSFVTVFQVLTGENWNDVLWGAMKASNLVGALYFLALNLIGGFIILNLFLAILLARFEGSSEEDADEEDVGLGADANKSPGELSPNSSSKDMFNASPTKVAPAPRDPFPTDVHTPESAESHMEHTIIRKTKSLMPVIPDRSPGRVRKTNSFEWRELSTSQPELEDELTLSDTALGVLGTSNSFRKSVFSFISNPKFDGFILFLIGISSIMLAMDEPWVEVCACFDPDDPKTHFAACDTELGGNLFNAALGQVPGNSRTYLDFLVYSDLVITIIFVFEMLLKMIGLGLIRGKDSYMRSGWNVLDFFIVILSVIGLATGPLVTGFCMLDVEPSAGGGILKALRSMRALRALRPLRVVRRYPALRLVVMSIMNAGPAIANVLIVMTLFFLIFAIFGVQSFKGALAQCNDGDIGTFAECVGNFTLTGTSCGLLPTAAETHQCVVNGDTGAIFERRWESLPANFDHVGNGFLTIFELASGEMWPDIMYNTVDAVGANHSLVPNTNRVGGALFHIFVQLVCAFLMVNVFVGVVIEKYNENKEASQGAGMLTNKQKLWLETMKLAMTGKAIRQDRPPHQFWRKPFFTLVKMSYFDSFIMLCIGLNTVVLMATQFDEGEEAEATLESMNYIFTLIFSAEFVLKLTGMGKQYFYYGWNIFDFSLVILSWVGEAFTLGGLASLFRVFRVARMIRLIRSQKGLLNLFKTLLFSLPALVNIGCIVFLFMFIFSCISMNLFANVKLQDNLNENANFQTFFRSFNTLWRVATGESYNALMHDAQIQPPYCDPYKGGAVDPNTGNCGFPEVSPILFCFIMVFINYMLLNLLIAVILDNFTETQSLSNNAITDEHFESFDKAWNMFDETGDGLIDAHLIPRLLNRVLYPLGLQDVPMANLHGATIRKHANKMVKDLNVPIVHGMVDFTAMRSALNHYAMGDIELPEEASAVQEIKKLRSKKLGGAQQKIERRMTKKTGKLQRVSGAVNGSIIGDGNRKGVEETGGIDEYNFTHVIASTTISSLLRGAHTRMILTRWRRMVRFAKTDQTVHPLMRTRKTITDQNFKLLATGVTSIAHRSTLSKIAGRARSNAAIGKSDERGSGEFKTER
jgi:hypothetical protein